MQDNRAAVAKTILRLVPQPLAVRRIREGGIAVVFPLGPSLEYFADITSFADIPARIEPPRWRQGSSGVIRGDFSAADEVYELYAIHETNPAKVEQLGDKPILRLFFAERQASNIPDLL